MNKSKLIALFIGFGTCLKLLADYGLSNGNDLVTMTTAIFLVINYSFYNSNDNEYKPLLTRPMLLIIAFFNIIDNFKNIITYIQIIKVKGCVFFLASYLIIVALIQVIPRLLRFSDNGSNKERDKKLISMFYEARKSYTFWIAVILSLMIIVISYIVYMSQNTIVTEATLVIGWLVLSVFLVFSIMLIIYIAIIEMKSKNN